MNRWQNRYLSVLLVLIGAGLLPWLLCSTAEGHLCGEPCDPCGDCAVCGHGCTCDCSGGRDCADNVNPCPSMCCMTSCFVAGTAITMADGSAKPIEEIRAGDKVMSEEAGSLVSSAVLELESPMREGYYDLELEDGTLLRLTGEHPIYTTAQDDAAGWASIEPAETLRDNGMSVRAIASGDRVKKQDGSWVGIVQIAYVEGPVRTYNLKRIEAASRVFFAEGVYVHNKAPECPGNGCETADGENWSNCCEDCSAVAEGRPACVDDPTCFCHAGCSGGVSD